MHQHWDAEPKTHLDGLTHRITLQPGTRKKRKSPNTRGDTPPKSAPVAEAASGKALGTAELTSR